MKKLTLRKQFENELVQFQAKSSNCQLVTPLIRIQLSIDQANEFGEGKVCGKTVEMFNHCIKGELCQLVHSEKNETALLHLQMAMAIIEPVILEVI
jgi:hypothetical protein